MGIDEMVMCSPLAPRTRTAREEVVIENYSSDDLIRDEWTLESYRPSSLSIHISAEVDEIAYFCHFEWSDNGADTADRDCSIF
jgi:hypothetical protein